MAAKSPARTSIGLSPDIPLSVRRDLLKLSTISQDAQAQAQQAQSTANEKIGRSVDDLNFVAQETRSRLQPGGVAVLTLTGLLGHAAQPQIAGVPNLKKAPAGGPYAQPTSLFAINGVLYGYTTGPNTPLLPYVSPVLSGTHAQRLSTYPATNYPAGMLFYETDRDVFYIVEILSTVATWIYASGQMYCNFTLKPLPTDLSVNDIGFLAFEDTYAHGYYWNGTAFVFADGGNGQIVAFYNSAPVGPLWGLCNGSTYTIAKADGTGTTALTSPNLIGDVFLKGGTPAAQQPATKPTWQAGAVTDLESSHTHSVHVIGNNSYGAGSFGAVADQTVTSSGGTPHDHGLSDANAVLNAPSEANGGLPLRIALAWYIRL